MGRLLSTVVGCWRLQCCLVVNCRTSRPLERLVVALVGCGRLLAAAAVSYCKLQ